MKIIPLHITNSAIVYKNPLCSLATLIVMTLMALSVMVPMLLVSFFSPYSGIPEVRIVYEQPEVDFKFQYIFLASMHLEEEMEQSLIACTSFSNLNAYMIKTGNYCEGIKYWTEDLDLDTNSDRIHFELQLIGLVRRVKSINLLVFFDVKLQHKCPLSPPAILTFFYTIPYCDRSQAGRLSISTELKLKQHKEFNCSFFGRNSITQFMFMDIDNDTQTEMVQYQIESLLKQVEQNPGYFVFEVQQTLFKEESSQIVSGLGIDLELNIPPLPVGYHLSTWERLGQFWLYFASFFGISFYIINKLKDFLFGQHIIRSYETTPWKKFY